MCPNCLYRFNTGETSKMPRTFPPKPASWSKEKNCKSGLHWHSPQKPQEVLLLIIYFCSKTRCSRVTGQFSYPLPYHPFSLVTLQYYTCQQFTGKHLCAHKNQWLHTCMTTVSGTHHTTGNISATVCHLIHKFISLDQTQVFTCGPPSGMHLCWNVTRLPWL